MSRHTSCNHGASLLLSVGSSFSQKTFFAWHLSCLKLSLFRLSVSKQGSALTGGKFPEQKNRMSLKICCITNAQLRKAKVIAKLLFRIWKCLHIHVQFVNLRWWDVFHDSMGFTPTGFLSVGFHFPMRKVCISCNTMQHMKLNDLGVTGPPTPCNRIGVQEDNFVFDHFLQFTQWKNVQ